MDNDDILFYWSMLIASWEEGVADKILTMIVDFQRSQSEGFR